MALALLLALFAQPAWAIAHVAIHDHLALEAMARWALDRSGRLGT